MPSPEDLPRWPAGPLSDGARVLVAALQAAGHRALFVGGAVRNWLLSRPLEDIDIATSATPEEVRRVFPAARGVGAHFGVMLVREGGHVYEIATFRAEGGYTDRRRPDVVRFGTLEEDFVRRDFTINAMYYDPLSGGLIDPAGGRADLAMRLLRAVGDPDRRFEEDALRMMRAVRFAARYGLTLGAATHTAIVTHAPLLAEISIERIGDELARILTGPHPGRAMHLMHELRLWPRVIPEIEAMIGCEQPPQFHPEGDVFIHTAMVLDALADQPGPPSLELALAALLHDVGKPPTFTVRERIMFPEHQKVGAQMAEDICRRLRYPNRTVQRVRELVAGHMRFMDVRRMKRATLRRFIAQPHFDEHLRLHRADCEGSHRKLDNLQYCEQELQELRVDADQAAQTALLPEPLVTGHDLLELGLAPGPRVGELLEAVREEQLEGRLTNREQARHWLRERIAGGGATGDTGER